MDFNSSDIPVELSDAELAAVQGGGVFGWLRRNLVDPVVDYITGKNNQEKPWDIYRGAPPYVGPEPQYAPGSKGAPRF